MVTGLSEHHVSVNFVDRGHSMTVEKKHLRSITPQLLALPFQAIRCSLAGNVVMLRITVDANKNRKGDCLFSKEINSNWLLTVCVFVIGCRCGAPGVRVEP